MADLAKSKKYFNLSNVRLAHRAKDDTFHLTAQDEDFPEGFHMTLSSGSNLELRVRDLFEDSGLVSQAPESKPKAICVAVPPISDSLASIQESWEFLTPLSSITHLQNEIIAGGPASEADFFFLMDSDFDPEGKDRSFEQFIVAVASSGDRKVGIISYNKKLADQIRERLDKSFLRMTGKTSDGFFFVEYRSPKASIHLGLANLSIVPAGK